MLNKAAEVDGRAGNTTTILSILVMQIRALVSVAVAASSALVVHLLVLNVETCHGFSVGRGSAAASAAAAAAAESLSQKSVVRDALMSTTTTSTRRETIRMPSQTPMVPYMVRRQSLWKG